MNYPNILRKKPFLFLLIPALAAFFVALVPTLKYQWPLSWDIFFHVHIAQLYLEHGLTFWDPLTCSPYGRPIGYPPLFHFFIASLSIMFKKDLFSVVRLLQPIVAFSMVFSISFLAYRFYGLLPGISTGILTIYSFITINRALFVSPETFGLILLPFALYAFFISNKRKEIKYLLLSGVLSGIILLIHSLSAFALILTVITFTVFMKIFKRDIKINYSIYFLIITGLIGLVWWGPLYFIFHPQYNIIPGPPCPFSYFFFLYFGLLPAILATIGGFILWKNGNDKAIMIFSWAIPFLLLSRFYHLGVNIVSIRMLEFASYPLIIMAGVGFVIVLNYLKIKLGSRINQNKIKVYVFLIFGGLTFISGVILADGYTPNLIEDQENTHVFTYDQQIIFNPIYTLSELVIITDRYGDLSLALDRKSVMEWFVMKGEKDKTVFSSDPYMDTIIASTSRVHVIKGGYSENMPSNIFKIDTNNIGGLNKSQLIKDNVKYILLRNGMDEMPAFCQVVYKNQHFSLCKIPN
ncbi:MAG TPA: hypothetical protein GX531_02270 [Methanothermobacter sp.]|nr:hypothetical protein [Methanothermobacter sp.]